MKSIISCVEDELLEDNAMARVTINYALSLKIGALQGGHYC